MKPQTALSFWTRGLFLGADLGRSVLVGVAFLSYAFLKFIEGEGASNEGFEKAMVARMPYVGSRCVCLGVFMYDCGLRRGSGAVESKERAPEANVDPSRIDSGSYLADNGFGYSADVWYIDGDTSRPGFYLEAWTVVLPVFFDEGGKPIDPDCDATIKDKHLVPSEECESGYDIVFVDPMTCYDSVSNTWYSRGDYNAVMAKVVNTKWKSLTNESIEIELREDGTLVESRDGKQAEAGTWAITAVDQVGLYWDDEDPAWNYAIHCDSNGKADKLDWGFDGSGDYARVD